MNQTMNDLDIISWDYYGLANNPSFFGTQTDWNQTLYTQIRKIYKRYSNPHQPLNTIIAGPTTCEVIEDMKSFNYGEQRVSPGRYNLIGRLANRFDVWETFDLKNNDAIYVGNVDLRVKHCHDDIERIMFGEIDLYPIQILNLPGDNR